MQVTKYAFFLVLGIAAQACGGGSDGDGGGGDDSGGGTSGKGGSTGSGGTSSGKGGASSSGGASGAATTGGSTGTGGAATGGSTGTGGSTSTGGSGGAMGGCMDGQVDLLTDPNCEEFFTCYFEAICAAAGAQQAQCVEATKEALQMGGACVPTGTDVAMTCMQFKTLYGSAVPACQ
ncbi:MAG TPA: hypothetical protein VF103_14865 [Polyangiaceae bacterium]